MARKKPTSDDIRAQLLEGWFDRDEFDATTATKSMWKGLPDWWTME